MLTSLRQWNPNLPMNIPMLRKSSGCREKVEWNAELEAEDNAVGDNENTKKKLKLIIEGANTIGTGFLLVQHPNDDEPE